MKKTLLLTLVAFLVIVMPALAQNRETRNVGTFTKISFRIPGKFYLRQGNTQKVEIEGSKEVLSRIETKLDGSQLTIHTPDKWNWKWAENEKVTIYITVKDVEAVSVAGSGDLVGETRFYGRDMRLSVSGSGSMKMEVELSGEVEADVSGSGELTVRGKAGSMNSDVSGSGRVNADLRVERTADFGISGSGKIEAKGSAQEVKTSISGSGKVLGADFEVVRCSVRISGSGNVEINVKDELDATISGSGSVSYRGNPGKVHSNSSGSGRVSKM